MSLSEYNKKLTSGFFAFWLTQWRTTFLVLILIVLIGTFAAIRIPKESSPDVSFGMVVITTVYPWASSQDIDSLITEKVENQIKNIDGIDKITSTSVDSVSSTTVMLKNDADADTVTSEIQDSVRQLSLPKDANDPVVKKITSKNNSLFNLVLYSKNQNFNVDYLKERAWILENALEGKGAIDQITVTDGDKYDIEILVDQTKLESLGIPLSQVASSIQAFNSNQPLGTHKIGDREYAFRIDVDVSSIVELKQLPISVSSVNVTTLENIESIKKVYADTTDLTVWNKAQWDIGKVAVDIMFEKKSSSSVLSAAVEAKKRIEEEMKKQIYHDIWYFYTNDLWEYISEDYSDLAVNMVSTLAIVFVIVSMFVWGMESFIATISIPLAFFITFFVLNFFGYTMNFLTNFSLIICLGIAVDTATVVVQGASEFIKLGYRPLNAALLSVKTYKNSLISGTATTVVVFFPLMSLPWVMGKFLAYIPITIFVTLLASLFISLTITPALFFKSSREKKLFTPNPDAELTLTEDEKFILVQDRGGKVEKTESSQRSWRDKIFDPLNARYDKHLGTILQSAGKRVIVVIIPLVVTIFTMWLVSPQLGFIMMPASDNEYLTISLTAKVGLTKEAIKEKSQEIHQIFGTVPELVNYTSTIKGNKVDVLLRISKKWERKRSSFEVEKDLIAKLDHLVMQGFQVAVATRGNGPATGKEIWIKIIADGNASFDNLSKVSRDFKHFLASIPGTKNVSSSSEESAGQFLFELDDQKLALLGLTPQSIGPSLYLALNGLEAGSIKWEYDTHKIRVKYDDFSDGISPEQLMNTSIITPAGKVLLGNIGSYVFKPSTDAITREKNQITISIWANLENGYKAEPINAKLTEYAGKYQFPAGISSSAWGETEENSDLLLSLLSALIFSLIAIFAILVLQFNSYTQPTIISYSILMGFVGGSFWMLLTGHPYSLMFMIGFIALVGIVVNNAIILIDSANENMKLWHTRADAIRESARSRLRPILSTTLTTVIGLATLTSDGFFAPLAYTIMFGLSIATVMTLFAIPALYQDEYKLRLLIKRCLLKPLLMIGAPWGLLGMVYLICLLFGIPFIGTVYGNAAAIALFASWMLFLIGAELVKNCRGEQWWRQHILWMIPYSLSGEIRPRQIIKRILIKFGVFLLPLILWLLTGGLASLVSGNAFVSQTASTVMTIVAYLFYLVGNLYSFWTSPGHQFLHDRFTQIGFRLKKHEDQDSEPVHNQ